MQRMGRNDTALLRPHERRCAPEKMPNITDEFSDFIEA